ncbi:arabinan endo-1,5-alpha-L-arabinosidase [Bacteroides sp. AF39-16AC]|uniref:family 43 glycosylhydrolase n=1 Tax=Bacteroides sp. AF39-16AC TaxID=2292936 RepID=UPI000EA102CA|nr:family 43 glycosylhydrolase [Bacteroides sp. AF39-16AC]RJU16714.1 arabinan endo-1,5-alpha-L-arabinosidase [Bacteroides sp. AF39-16AC]
MKLILTWLILFAFVGTCSPYAAKETEGETELRNPILPGYFADPSVVQFDGKFYLYTTADPWGTDFLSCWVSDDFQNWTFHQLNWPTKSACKTSLSEKNKVWAPSVIQKGNMFYMYVSVGSEVWCGRARHPLGPWENMLDGFPLIPGDTTKYYHVIDAEVFIDDDDKAYLYWGSGWNWTNGHCFVAELGDDMCSFRQKPVEVTPSNYFEAPLMKKHNGKYYLTYSEGKTIDETYEVRYAVGDSPLGPFEEAKNSPVLRMNDSLQVYGPGHHTLFSYGDEDYILYHRHRLPFTKGTAYRQTCIAKLTFDDAKNEILPIIPYHALSFPDLGKDNKICIKPDKIMASSELADFTLAENVLDRDNATRWEPSVEDRNPMLTIFLENVEPIGVMEVRFEYPWKTYFMKVETSTDGQIWEKLADYTDVGISGSPVNISLNRRCKCIRLAFVDNQKKVRPSIWELCLLALKE